MNLTHQSPTSHLSGTSPQSDLELSPILPMDIPAFASVTLGILHISDKVKAGGFYDLSSSPGLGTPSMKPLQTLFERR